MKLAELQQKLADYIYSAHPTDAAREEILALLSKETPVDPAQSLELYRKNLVFGIVDSLQGVFEQTQRILGEENFAFFVRELIYHAPSTHEDVRQYGAHLPGFLAERAELADSLWIGDIAAIEWAWHALAFISLAEPARIADMHERPQTVHVIDALTLLKSRWPLIKIWQSLQSEPRHALKELVVLDPEETHFCIWRAPTGLKFKEIAPEIAQLITELRQGLSPAALAEQDCTGRSIATTWEMLAFAADQGWLKRV